MKGALFFLIFALHTTPLFASPCEKELGKGGVCSPSVREKRGIDEKTCLKISEARLSEACKESVIPMPTGSALLFYASLILIGGTVFLIARMIFADEESFKAAEQIGETSDKAQKQNYADHGIILRYSRPFFKRYISPIIQNMKGRNKIKKKYKRILATAGLTDDITPEDFLAFKVFLILGFPIVFLAVRLFLEETWPLSYIPLIAVLGFFYPDIWIRGKIDRRKKDVVMNMPFIVDMLALSVEAGLDFVAGMTKVIEKAKKSALSDEFKILIKEIKIGASRAEALRNMAWRLDMVQISSFCATLIAADSVGASIGPILKALAKEIREKKSAQAEKAGATAATKILFPMLFLIVPAVFLMIGAPFAIQMMSGG